MSDCEQGDNMTAGMKLVPVEPTEEMLRAAQTAWLNDPARRTTTMWRAMLAAAPAPVAEAGEADRLRARVAAAYESAAPAAEATPIGWIYVSPDTGIEFAANHPVESGECTDAENIRAATDEVLRDELVQAWRDLKDVERMLAEAQDRAAEAGDVERLRAALEHVAWSGKFQCFDDASWDIVNDALASTAPSCPPGHVLINGRAVPEPMREAPEIGGKYWVPLVQVDSEASTFFHVWRNDDFDRAFLLGGLCHSTEAAARAHAEALLAPSKREDV